MKGLENVSTLMDGELDGDDAAREINRLKTDSSNRATWDAYHLIGDAMRDGASGAPALSAGFSARFSERLAQEPTVLAPRATRFPSRVRTYALSAAASVMAMAVVGWMALSTPSPVKPDAPGALAIAPGQPPAAIVKVLPQVANVQVPPAATQPQFANARDATSEYMHEYLLAHQGISPTTAIQGVTPYIRTVSNSGD